MHVTNPFPFVLVFLSITSIATPLSPPTNAMLPVGNALNWRQTDIELCPTGVVDGFEDLTDPHDAESRFTQQAVSDLLAQFPGKNVLVYHNPDSLFQVSPDATHVHCELDLGLGFTQGYEVWVFDSGIFSLVGDGGYVNWAYGGCASGPSTDVVFTTCSS